MRSQGARDRRALTGEAGKRITPSSHVWEPLRAAQNGPLRGGRRTNRGLRDANKFWGHDDQNFS